MDLHSFAKNGNIKGIKQSLKNKKAMLALDEDMGWSPLHYASNSSKAKIVQLILNAGINPNIKSAPPKKQKQSDWNLALEENENSKAPIVYPMDVEVMEVVIVPTHGNLDNMMQVGHGGRSAHPQAAPDHRADTARAILIE